MGLTAKKVYAVLNKKIKDLSNAESQTLPQSDKTLTVDGGYADGKTVGEEFQKKANKQDVENLKTTIGTLATKTEVANKADKQTVSNIQTEIDKLATKDQLNGLATKEEVEKKANKATTLSGYGITDATPKAHMSDGNAHEDIRTNITTLKEDLEGLNELKADAIVETAQGDTMTLTDSSDKLFEGLRVFGKSTQDGTPSVENPVPIVNAGESGSIKVEVTGRNLIDYTKAKGDADIQFVDGDFIVGGDKRNRIINLPCNIQKGKSYTIDFKENHLLGSNNVNCYLPGGKYSVSGNAPQQYGIIKKRPFIANDDYTAFGIYHELKNVSVSKSEITDICLVKTGMDTDYEPYTHQSLTLATPNGLPGIKVSKDGNYTDKDGQQWVCDEIDMGRGKYVQRVKKSLVALKKDSYTNPDGYRYALNGFADAHENYTEVLSDKFRYSKNASHSSGDITFSGIRMSPKYDTLVAFEKSDLPPELIETTVYYIIATPIERDLTPEELAAYEALHTNYPTTVITNDAGAHMEANYVADTKAYINKKFEELNQAIVKTQIALL